MGWYELGNSPQRCPSQTVYAKINLCGVEHFNSFLTVLNFTAFVATFVRRVSYFLKLIPIPPPELFQGTPIIHSYFPPHGFSYSEIQVIITAREQNTITLASMSYLRFYRYV